MSKPELIEVKIIHKCDGVEAEVTFDDDGNCTVLIKDAE